MPQIDITKKIIFIFISLLVLQSCINEKNAAHNEQVTVKSDELIKIIGKWELYWEQLLEPEDFKNNPNLKPVLVDVPSPWRYYEINGESLPSWGYATYRAKIKIENTTKADLAVYVPLIWCSSKVFVNGDLVHEAGKIATNYDDFENNMIFHLSIPKFQEDQSYVEIVAQVSNFDFLTGGIIRNFAIGTYDLMNQYLESKDTLQVFILTTIFIIAFYNLLLFYYHRSNKVNLYFSLLCFAMFIKGLVFSHHYLYEYLKNHDLLPFMIQSKAYYISTFGLIGLGILYINNLYPNHVNKKIIKYFQITLCVYLAFILLTPPAIFILTVEYFQPVLAFGGGIVLFMLFKAYRKREPFIYWQALGICIVIAAGVFDAINFIKGFKYFSGELLPIALTSMIFVQFIILGKIYSNTLNDLAYLNLNLEKEVDKKTEILASKNVELNVAYTKVQDSVRYASRIQNAIFDKEAEIKYSFKESFVWWIAKDIVSGDFYWFKRIKKNEGGFLKILVVGDCTGHGVPGALLTVMGNTILHEATAQKSDIRPAQLLKALDESVKTHLSQTNADKNVALTDGMDLAVVIFDEDKQKGFYGGAKRPLFCYHNYQLEVHKGKNLGIGYTGRKRRHDFVDSEFDLRAGSTFYLFSDGVTDQFDKDNNKKFTTRKFKELINSVAHLPLSDQKERIVQTFVDWKGKTAQIDDIIVVGVRI